MKQCYTFLILMVLMISAFESKAQIPTGLKNASNMISQTVSGTISWGDPLSALLNDGSATSVTALILGDDTDYLTATGFNIVIPPGMIVSGIQVEIVKSGSNGLLYSVTDKDVRIVKGGVRVGNNLALAGKWPSTDQAFTYGGNTEVWGTTWTVAEVESADFGVAISAHLGGVLLPTANINSVRVNVFYESSPLPVTLINFEAKTLANAVQLDWSTATEVNNYGFTVQRSADGSHWENIEEIRSETSTSNAVRKYTHTDYAPLTGKNYYRLKQIDLDKNVAYSFISVADVKVQTDLLVYPNPSHGVIHIARETRGEDNASVVVSDLWGRAMQSYEIAASESEWLLNVSSLPAGDYLLSMTFDNEVVNRRIRIVD